MQSNFEIHFFKHRPSARPVAARLVGVRLGLVLSLSTFLLTGCEGTTTSPSSADPRVEVAKVLPQPPPQIKSETQIVSGGWLLAGDGTPPLFDAVVVITGDTIAAIGKRGTIDVPNDSVGIDASGRWVVPGPLAELRTALNKRTDPAAMAFSSPEFAPIAAGRRADLVLLKANPATTNTALDDVYGEITGGLLKRNESSTE